MNLDKYGYIIDKVRQLNMELTNQCEISVFATNSLIMLTKSCG